jgi:hypothetical protein
MKSFALIAVLFAAALMPGAALAYCPHFPDDARTHYVENGQRHLICLEGELNDSTAAQTAQVQLQQSLAELQAQIARQQAQAQALAAQSIAQPAIPSLQ